MSAGIDTHMQSLVRIALWSLQPYDIVEGEICRRTLLIGVYKSLIDVYTGCGMTSQRRVPNSNRAR